MTLGERIVHYRNEAGLTQKALAERMGISNSRLNYWEKDKREPDVKMLNLLCQVLDVDANVLLGKEESPGDTKTPPSRTEPSQGEDVTKEEMEAIDRLIAAGLIKEDVQLSDSDVEFLSHILTVVDMWFEESRHR